MFSFLCRFAPGGLTLRSAGPKKGKKAPGEKLSALTPVPDDAESGRVSVCLARRNCQPTNLRSPVGHTAGTSGAACAAVIGWEVAPPRAPFLRFYHHQCAEVSSAIKLARFPIRHPNASVRCRHPRQIALVQSVTRREFEKVGHRC